MLRKHFFLRKRVFASLSLLAACVATEPQTPASEVEKRASNDGVGIFSPIAVDERGSGQALVSVSFRNLSQNKVCIGGLSPLSASLANDVPVSDMFVSRNEPGGDKVIVVPPGAAYTWRERFVFSTKVIDATVAGGTVEQDQAAKEALASGLENAVVVFRAMAPVFVCDTNSTMQEGLQRPDLLKFGDVVRLSASAHLEAAPVRYSGFQPTSEP